VVALVSTLADNLNGQPLNGVNSKCLSITLENMWPDTLGEIFGRIGANKVWERLGQQALLRSFFQVDQHEKATTEAKKFLTRFMELRNQIAHPSGALSWPSLEQTMKHVDFCETKWNRSQRRIVPSGWAPLWKGCQGLGPIRRPN
jgi:hypothetical protein